MCGNLPLLYSCVARLSIPLLTLEMLQQSALRVRGFQGVGFPVYTQQDNVWIIPPRATTSCYTRPAIGIPRSLGSSHGQEKRR